MSLDVTLIAKRQTCQHCGHAIDVESLPEASRTAVYSANITHNLGKMAMEAGIYMALWRPEEMPYKTAAELVPVLEEGLAQLKADQAHFEKFNAPNGWGMYEHFVPFVEQYLEACRGNPDAEIRVSR